MINLQQQKLMRNTVHNTPRTQHSLGEKKLTQTDKKVELMYTEDRELN